MDDDVMMRALDALDDTLDGLNGQDAADLVGNLLREQDLVHDVSNKTELKENPWPLVLQPLSCQEIRPTAEEGEAGKNEEEVEEGKNEEEERFLTMKEEMIADEKCHVEKGHDIDGVRWTPHVKPLQICSVMGVIDIFFGRRRHQRGPMDLTELFSKMTPVNDDYKDGVVGFCFNETAKGAIRVPARQFQRQVQCVVRAGGDRNISVKIFSTGKLHGTGASSVANLGEAFRFVSAAIGATGIDDVRCDVNRIEICNINFTFSIALPPAHALDLSVVTRVVRKHPSIASAAFSTQSERRSGNRKNAYPGIKMALQIPGRFGGDDVSSVFFGLFQTGSAIVTKCKSEQDVHDAFDIASKVLLDALRRRANDVLISSKRHKRNRTNHRTAPISK